MRSFTRIVMIICSPFYYLDNLLTSVPGAALIYAPAGIAMIVGIACYFRDLFIRDCLGEGLGLVAMTILYFGGLSVICSVLAIACQLLACVLRFICYPGVQIYYLCRNSYNKAETSNTSTQKQVSHDQDELYARAYCESNLRRQHYEEMNRQKEREEAERRKQAAYQQAWERKMYEKVYNKAYQDASIKINNSEKNQYEKSRTLFMLNDGYTDADLKRQYHRLLKAFHPDNDGTTTDEAQKINIAYNLLKKYAR